MRLPVIMISAMRSRAQPLAQRLYANDYWDPNDLQPGQPSRSNNQKRTRYTARYGNKRERVELSLSQQLWAGASLYANVSHQNYWGVSGNDRTIQLGYNDGFKRISYGVYLQDTRGQYGYSDRSVNFTMSIPLDWGQNNNSTTANFSAAHSKQSGDSYSTGISGTMLDDRRMNYSVSTGHTQSSGQSSNLNRATAAASVTSTVAMPIARNTASKGWASPVACWCTPAARP